MMARRRFRPRWWAALLTAAFVAVTIRLGHWQGDRAAFKLSEQSTYDEALLAPPLPLPRPRDAVDRERFRRVSGEGRFDPDALWYLDNRIHEGRAGYEVIQLFQLQPSDPSGTASAATRWLVVNRGWVPVGDDRSVLPPVETPDGVVALQGRINRAPSRHPGTHDNAASRRLNYLDLGELERIGGKPVDTYVVELTGGPGWLGTERRPPAARVETHRIYQLQWYSMAALAAVLFVVLSLRKTDPADP